MSKQDDKLFNQVVAVIKELNLDINTIRKEDFLLACELAGVPSTMNSAMLLNKAFIYGAEVTIAETNIIPEDIPYTEEYDDFDEAKYNEYMDTFEHLYDD